MFEISWSKSPWIIDFLHNILLLRYVFIEFLHLLGKYIHRMMRPIVYRNSFDFGGGRGRSGVPHTSDATQMNSNIVLSQNGRTGRRSRTWWNVVRMPYFLLPLFCFNAGQRAEPGFLSFRHWQWITHSFSLILRSPLEPSHFYCRPAGSWQAWAVWVPNWIAKTIVSKARSERLSRRCWWNDSMAKSRTRTSQQTH